MSTPPTHPDRAGDLASISRRVAAQLVDEAVAVLVLCVGYGLLIAGLLNGSASVLIVGMIAAPVLGLGYTVWFIVHQGRTGGSPGKHALGIRTVDQDTLRPIGVGRILVRQLVIGVLGPLNLIQLFLIGRHPRRQGWHDRAARSVVVPAATLERPTRDVDAQAPAPVRGPRSPAPLAAPSATPISEPAGVPSAPSPLEPAAPRKTSGPPVIEPSAPPVMTSAPVGMVAPPPGVSPPPTSTASSSVVPDLPAATPPPVPSAAMRREWLVTPVSGSPHMITPNVKVLVGRDPDPSLVEGAVAWLVDDPALTVSKTHALLGRDGDSCWIEDWHSTNGVELHRLGDQRLLLPHERTVLQTGDVILLGDFRLSVSEVRP